MKKLSLYTSAILLAVMATSTGFAKDDKKKDKDKDNDRGRDRDHVEYVDKDHDHDRDHDRDRDNRSRDNRYSDRSRTIYVIERDRPVERVVYIDRDGHYYRVIDGRRIYVRDRYFESYPSKYYYPDGRRRVTITLPF